MSVIPEMENPMRESQLIESKEDIESDKEPFTVDKSRVDKFVDTTVSLFDPQASPGVKL